jgi:hypothetical protein
LIESEIPGVNVGKIIKAHHLMGSRFPSLKTGSRGVSSNFSPLIRASKSLEKAGLKQNVVIFSFDKVGLKIKYSLAVCPTWISTGYLSKTRRVLLCVY